MIASYREVDYSTHWSNWSEDTRYFSRRYAKYGICRLWAESLCYAVLAFLTRWAVYRCFVPHTRWVSAAGLTLTVVGFPFALLAGFISLLFVAAVVFDILSWANAQPVVVLGYPPSRAVLPPVRAGAGSRPPKMPSVLLEVFVPRRDRDAIIGDLEETYREEFLPRYGRRTAAFVYWVRCLREVGSFCWPVVRKYVPWTVLAGAVCTGKWKWLAEVFQHLAR
jgi:hypothetical protein